MRKYVLSMILILGLSASYAAPDQLVRDETLTDPQMDLALDELQDLSGLMDSRTMDIIDDLMDKTSNADWGMPPDELTTEAEWDKLNTLMDDESKSAWPFNGPYSQTPLEDMSDLLQRITDDALAGWKNALLDQIDTEESVNALKEITTPDSRSIVEKVGFVKNPSDASSNFFFSQGMMETNSDIVLIGFNFVRDNLDGWKTGLLANSETLAQSLGGVFQPEVGLAPLPIIFERVENWSADQIREIMENPSFLMGTTDILGAQMADSPTASLIKQDRLAELQFTGDKPQEGALMRFLHRAFGHFPGGEYRGVGTDLYYYPAMDLD